MMRVLMQVFFVVALASGVSACGNKGKLKSPTQMQVQDEKKARKVARGEKVVKPASSNDKQESPVGVLVTPSNEVTQ